MSVVLTTDLLKRIAPKMSDALVNAFVTQQNLMSEILETPERTAFAFANMMAETGEFSLASLTENIRYTPERMAAVWPNRFNRGRDARGNYIPDPSKVVQKYGDDANWQLRAFDDIYGGRMGNRPGSRDGSMYIGRGVPQITGRDGYTEVGNRIKVDLVNNPNLATKFDLQPAIMAAFWDWKRFERFCGVNGVVDLRGGRKVWNGGDNGLDVVQKHYPRIYKLLKSYNPTTVAVNVAPPTAKKDDELATIQSQLIDFGYFEIGDVDGLMGGKTRGAITAFFNDRGVIGDPVKSQFLRDEIDKAISENWHRPVAPKRAFATEKDIAPKVASIKPANNAGLLGKITAWFTSGTTIVGGAVKLLPDANDQASPYVSMLQQWFPSIPTLVFFAIVAIIAVVMVIQINKAKQATVEDYQQGKIN